MVTLINSPAGERKRNDDLTVADRTQVPRAILLGAHGKVGRGLRKAWTDRPPGRFSILPVARVPQDPDVLEWHPGQAFSRAGPVRAVLAMWGVAGGSGEKLNANERLAIQALELAAALGAGTVVHCSSAAVYGPGTGRMSETTEPRPASEYGLSKLRMERAIADWHRQNDAPVRSLILRIGNVAGGDSLFANLGRGKTVTLDRFADGRGPVRSYMGMTEMAVIVEALLEDPGRNGIYNVSAPRPTDMADVARAAGAELAWRAAPAGAVPRVDLSTEKLADVLPLDPLWAEGAHVVRSARLSGLWP